jgi:hypothetical protein
MADTAVDPTAQYTAPEPAPPDTDLDALLAEFDQSTKTMTAGNTAAPLADDFAERQQRANNGERSLSPAEQAAYAEGMQRAERDLKSVVTDVRADMPLHLYSDDFVQTWIDNQARQNLQLQRVWMNRDSSPGAFRAAVNQLSKKFYKTFRDMPDREATEDRNAVTAAMRGASSRAPEDRPPSYGTLSNAEYAKDVRERFGFDPGV